MYILVISITLANKEPKVSQIMGFFLEKLETFWTFQKVFWKSLNILDFFLNRWNFFDCLETLRFVLDSLNFLEKIIFSGKFLKQI